MTTYSYPAVMPKIYDNGPRVGYDVPLPNGCWKCIGCGVILPKNSGWNQCADCDERGPEDF